MTTETYRDQIAAMNGPRLVEAWNDMVATAFELGVPGQDALREVTRFSTPLKGRERCLELHARIEAQRKAMADEDAGTRAAGTVKDLGHADGQGAPLGEAGVQGAPLGEAGVQEFDADDSGAQVHVIPVNLTLREVVALRSIEQSEFQDGRRGQEAVGHPVWVFSMYEVPEASRGGVLASLKAKGCVSLGGTGAKGDEETVSLTALGASSLAATPEVDVTAAFPPASTSPAQHTAATVAAARARQAAPKSAPKSAPKYTMGSTITPAASNPYEEGTERHGIFAGVRPGMTVREFCDAHGKYPRALNFLNPMLKDGAVTVSQLVHGVQR